MLGQHALRTGHGGRLVRHINGPAHRHGLARAFLSISATLRTIVRVLPQPGPAVIYVKGRATSGDYPHGTQRTPRKSVKAACSRAPRARTKSGVWMQAAAAAFCSSVCVGERRKVATDWSQPLSAMVSRQSLKGRKREAEMCASAEARASPLKGSLGGTGALQG